MKSIGIIRPAVQRSVNPFRRVSLTRPFLAAILTTGLAFVIGCGSKKSATKIPPTAESCEPICKKINPPKDAGAAVTPPPTTHLDAAVADLKVKISYATRSTVEPKNIVINPKKPKGHKVSIDCAIFDKKGEIATSSTKIDSIIKSAGLVKGGKVIKLSLKDISISAEGNLEFTTPVLSGKTSEGRYDLVIVTVDGKSYIRQKAVPIKIKKVREYKPVKILKPCPPGPLAPTLRAQGKCR